MGGTGAGGGGTGAGAAAALCAIVIVCPATSSVPDRATPPFAATVALTEPLPVPLEPDPTEIQSVWLTAVHPQVPPDSTVTVSEPPSDGTVALAGLTVKRHAASCVIATCVLLTSIVPRRVDGSVFAAIR